MGSVQQSECQLGIRDNSWGSCRTARRRRKGLVKQQVITCQDVDPSGYRLLMPFDYSMNEDEKTKWAGKLQDKQIVIGVRELVPFGGRLRARGAIISGPEGK